MRVVIYARVSTEEQSNEQQLQSCREFCKNKSFEVVSEYMDVISGSKDSRPQLDLLMKASYRKEFDCVIVWKLDRLGRSLQHLVRIVNDWKAYGIDFMCVTQPFDTTSPSGKLLFYLMAAMAEFERDLIRERTIAGMKKAKNVGKRGKDKKPRKKGGYYLRHNPQYKTEM